MKNIGQYNQDLSVPRKKDIDSLETRVKTNEDNIAMAESDIEGLTTDVGTLKTDVGQVKTALNFKQDTITGGASTITDNNLTANHALVSNGSGKVGVSDVTSTELSYLDGVTSNVQTQLNSKQGIKDEIQAVRLRGGINSIINNASAVSINPAVNAIGFLLHNGGNVQIFYDGYLMPFQNQEIDTLFDGKSSTYINFGAGPSNAKNEGVCRWSETTQYPQNARVMYQTTSSVFRWYKALKESQGVIPEGDSTGAWEDVSISSSPNKMDVRNLDISIVIDSPLTFKYENGISLYWRASNQNCGYYKIEVYDSVQNQYALVAERDNIPEDEVVNTQYLGTKVNGDGKRARITLRSQPRQGGGWFAATQIALTGVGGGIEGTLVNRGGSTMYGNLSPYTDGGASLGTSSAQWKEVRAQNIYGNVNNTTSTFSQASSRTDILSGDKLSTIFGKIAKWFSDLGSLAFKSSVAKSDLVSDVQASLDKADSALQSAPVTSVNSKTGAVTLGAVDVGALPLTGGTLTGPLVLGNEDAQIKIGEAGVIFNPSQEEPQIVISDSHYATQYISLTSSQTKIVGGTQFTNTNMTLAPGGITIQKLESGVPSTATLSGISDGVNANDAVNVSQLNAVKSSIPSSSDFVKTSGGMVTGQLYLLGGTGPLAVKNGSVTLNEGYSIGYGDGNYNFSQINGQFQLMKNKSSSEGIFIGSQANEADDYVALQTVVNSATQPMSTHINVRSNGVIDLSHEDSSSGSYFVNDVRIQGVANGTANNEAVNWRQLKQYLPLAGGAMTGTLDMRSQKIINVADGTDDSDAATVRQAKAGSPKGPVMVMISNVTLGAAHEVIHNNLWDCTFLGTIYGTRYIDGVAVDIYPQSHIVSVGGSDYGDAGGFCAVQKSANSMDVVIKALCISSTAPSSIQIPCLVW